jgi:hypothetical protein
VGRTQEDARVTITLRTSKALHKWLIDQAKRNNRSLNQEIEYRLMQQREGAEARPLLDELRSIVEQARKK